MKMLLSICTCLLCFWLGSCQENIDNGLVLYYPFAGNAGDQTGNGNNGEPAGAVMAKDRFGQENSAFYFDGLTSAVTAQVSNMPAVDSPQSFSWWFRIDSIPSYKDERDAHNMIALVDSAAGVGVQFGFRAPGYQSLGFDTWYWGGRTVMEADMPAIGQWHHCVYTFDGGTHLFYIDGQQEATSKAVPQTGKPDILMLGNYPGGEQFFKGSLDDVRIYNRVLDLSEVHLLYKMKE